MLNLMKLKTANIRNIARCYKSAKDGVAAIEFAFVAPVMIFMYFGLAEISLAISVDRRVSHAINVAGDLATQPESITASDMSEIMEATLIVLGPGINSDAINIEIKSFSKDSSDAIITEGIATFNGPFPGGSFEPDPELDDLLLSENSGIVVARIEYGYVPLGLKFLTQPFKMQEKFLLKPRQSAFVDFIDEDGAKVDFDCNQGSSNPDTPNSKLVVTC